MEFSEGLEVDYLSPPETLAIPSNIPTRAVWMSTHDFCRSKEIAESWKVLASPEQLCEDDSCVIECHSNIPNAVNIVKAYSSLGRCGLSAIIDPLLGAAMLDWSIALDTDNMTRALLPSTLALVRSMRQVNQMGQSPLRLYTRYGDVGEVEEVYLEKPEASEFIEAKHIRAAADIARRLLQEYFEKFEIDVDVYHDPEEPEYHSLNFTIHKTGISEEEVDILLDRYESFQDKFNNSVDKLSALQITFHLDIS